MDRLQTMSVFIAVAEEQGFAAAARKLEMSAPAVTRAIAALELRLGVKLLHRTTRYVRTTDAGKRYLEDAKRIMEEVDAADEAAVGINSSPRGRIAVTAPVLFGQKIVMPGIVEYLNLYPETEVDTLFLDRVVNLVEEGLDVGVRIGKLPDSTLRAIPVGTVKLVTCASPKYAQDFGLPQTPEDLTNHTTIVSKAGKLSLDWRYQKQHQQECQEYLVRVKPRLSVITNDAAIRAAEAGFGITRLLSYQVMDCLTEGSLIRVLEDYEMSALPVHIVHREGRLASRRVRAFIDLMVEKLRANPALREVSL